LKQSKFGIFDIILAVVIVAGIGLNIYGYGFRGGSADARQSYDPPASQTQSGAVQAESGGNGRPTVSGDNSDANSNSAVENIQPPEASLSITPDLGDNEAPPPPGNLDYDTLEKPNINEFVWFTENDYFVENGRNKGIPAGARLITNFDDIAGSWKGLIYYDPNRTVYGTPGFYLANADISGTADEALLVWLFHEYIREDGSADDKEGEFDLYDNGKWMEGGGFYAGNPGDMYSFTSFYQLNGKQYAYGFYFLEGQAPVYIALVRP